MQTRSMVHPLVKGGGLDAVVPGDLNKGYTHVL